MFFIRSRERAGKEPLLSIELFRNRTSNLGLVTQNFQWLLLMGVSFVVSVFLQTERHYSAIKTGVIFTAATLGVLVSSLAAERLAKKYLQKTLISVGFGTTAVGIGLLLGLVKAASSSAWAFAPGLLLIGLGLGVMLTPSINLVQSAFPEEKQGEISGLSRSISNLGLILRHRDRWHDPGLQPRLGKRNLRRGDDRPRRRRPRRPRDLDSSPRQSSSKRQRGCRAVCHGVSRDRPGRLTRHRCPGSAQSQLVLRVRVCFAHMAERPNILFFHVDNLGFGELSCYSGGPLRGTVTERIDGFAAEGFRKWHVGEGRGR